MKPVLLALLIFTVSSISFAQLDSNLIAQRSYSPKSSPLFLQPNTPFKAEWLPPGYRMRKVGATITLVGAFLVGGGLIVYTSSGTKDARPYPQNFFGPLMIINGTAMAIPGIIFWTKGARTYKIYQAEQAATTASLHFIGNGVAYRF